MSDIVYRSGSLAHASKYSVGHYDRSKYEAAKQAKKDDYKKTDRVIGRRSYLVGSKYKYGSYASPYYDPVARHERYLRERESLGIGQGIGSSKSGRSGGSGKGSGRGSGKGSGRGSGRGSGANLAKAIQALREESSLNTQAQQEATRRKIADLKKKLKDQVNKLRGLKGDEEGVNVSEIRGNIQRIREEIQSTGGNLQDWIAQERDALERRIAAAYKTSGIKYKPQLQSDKTRASKKRNKEVNSRADAIYKSKSKK